jgi:hypothetical protein
MTDRIPPVSNSELTMFADCQRRWWFSYVLNRGPKRGHKPVTGALAFGTRIHNCLERRYQNGVQLRGKLDQLWRRDIDGALMFRDFKTAQDMRAGPASLPRDEQMMFYNMLMRLQRLEQGESPENLPRGGMYTMLKKVLRSARAQPPFYDQHEIMFNDRALRSMYLRTHRRVQQMLESRQALADGQPHQYVVPPRPSKDCSWKCPFVAVW